MALVLVVGIPLSIWGFWMRLGRTPGARAWSAGRNPERQLFAYPFFGAACVLAGVAALVDRVPALATVLTVAAIVAFLISFLFGLIGIPAPGFLKPRWFRELDRRAGKKSASRRRTAPPAAHSAVAAQPEAVDPAWASVREALRADIATLQPEGSIMLTADPQRFVEVRHYGNLLSVECAGSQAWGGPAPVSDEQDAALCRLGFTTPMQRRRELEQNPNFRIYLPTGEPSTPDRAAELAVDALAVLGVEPDAPLDRSLS